MKKKTLLFLSLIVAVGIFAQDDFNGKTIEINGTDGLTIYADIYESAGVNDPIILLFHQARFSRGEYRPIAPVLVELGFTCIAIDQRSGGEVNGIVNETYQQAKKKGLGTEYPDAFPDLVTTLKYAKEKYPERKIISWGSSYSAALQFVLGAKYPKNITAIVAFSPGEYFQFEGRSIPDFAEEVECPVFISSAKNEHDYWKNIYSQISSEDKASYLPNHEGIHGSRALWENNEGYEAVWEAVTEYLTKVRDKYNCN